MKPPIVRPRPWLVLAVACVVAWPSTSGGQDRSEDRPTVADPSRFADAIRGFEDADRAEPPRPDGILFVGSSSIRRWDLETSFPGLGALNRGFGGSQLSDVIHYADRVIVPARPRLIVLYAGENDLNAGKSPEQVRDDVLHLVRLVRDRGIDAPILFLAIKPSPALDHLRAEMRRANDLVALAGSSDDRLEFVDVVSPMLGPDGEPRSELFVDDRLHLNDLGYAAWAGVLGPILDEHFTGD